MPRRAPTDRSITQHADLAPPGTPPAAAQAQGAPDKLSGIRRSPATYRSHRGRADGDRRRARSRAMQSPGRSLVRSGEIEVLDRHIILTNHFQKFESACMPGAVAWTQSAEHLANRSVLVASSNGDQYARWMVAERRRKTCLFFGGQAGGREIGRTEPRDQVRRKYLNHFAAIFFVRIDDLHESRTPKRSQ